jgi:hypothetical protein
VLRLDTAARLDWMTPSVNGGLPLRDRTRFEPVETLTVTPGGRVVAGTPKGVFLQTGADQWASVANRESPEAVTVPRTWLLCSDEHDIEVVREPA